MSRDANYMSRQVNELINRTVELEERARATTSLTELETLDRQLKNVAAELKGLLESLANTRQPSDTSGTST